MYMYLGRQYEERPHCQEESLQQVGVGPVGHHSVCWLGLVVDCQGNKGVHQKIP